MRRVPRPEHRTPVLSWAHPPFEGDAPDRYQSRLRGFDLSLVIRAPVFRYYPHIARPVLPPGCQLLHVTNDPSDGADVLLGESLLGDAKPILEALLGLAGDRSSRAAPKPLHLLHVR
jgi:benzoylformate decarboxylase